MLKVKGEINGFAFRTSLFPTGKVTTTCSQQAHAGGAAARPAQ